RRVAKEDELAVRSKKPRGLWNPLVRIAPDRGAVFRDREIEGGSRKTGGFGVRLHELQAEPGLCVHPPRGFELRRRDIDADDSPGAAPFQPGRDVSGAAPEL